MLWKEDKTDKWHTREWRYFCECRTPQHVLLFEEDMEHDKTDLMLAIASDQNWGFWRRIKEAFKLIRGKEILYAEVFIDPEARKELGAAIAGEEIVT